MVARGAQQERWHEAVTVTANQKANGVTSTDQSESHVPLSIILLKTGKTEARHAGWRRDGRYLPQRGRRSCWLVLPDVVLSLGGVNRARGDNIRNINVSVSPLWSKTFIHPFEARLNFKNVVILYRRSIISELTTRKDWLHWGGWEQGPGGGL